MAVSEKSFNSVRIAVAAAYRLKATNIQAFDVSNMLRKDIMLVIIVPNEDQVSAVSDEIEKYLYVKENKRKPIPEETSKLSQWFSLDYGDFVVYVVCEDAIPVYRLDNLWNGLPCIDLRLPRHA
ncbi:RsfS/YbeB/iojap family protein [Gardnerella vaginalis]|uniref:RsfS/YbeB/iojap family protein n=1 Tax=Gardnerella vaginalis TaxID=2702 RepID=UPI0039EF2A9D|nr:RsfS/YbeB/iojap family protein [Bifidobacterium sp. UMB1197]